MITTEREKPPSRVRNLIVIIQPAGNFLEQSGKGTIRLYGPVEGQVSELITDHGAKSKREPQDGRLPKYFVVQATAEEFLKAAKDELKKRPNRNATKGCFTSLILIKPKAKKPSDNIDATTGIRVVGITDGQFRFPTHPTPAH